MKKTGLICLSVYLLITFINCNISNDQRITEKMDTKIDPSTFMWYDKPAEKWEESLPVGNGRLGAMIFGKYGEEQIQLNEETYWSGGPYSTVVAGGHKVLPQIQKYIFENEPPQSRNCKNRSPTSSKMTTNPKTT